MEYLDGWKCEVVEHRKPIEGDVFIVGHTNPKIDCCIRSSMHDNEYIATTVCPILKITRPDQPAKLAEWKAVEEPPTEPGLGIEKNGFYELVDLGDGTWPDVGVRLHWDEGDEPEGTWQRLEQVEPIPEEPKKDMAAAMREKLRPLDDPKVSRLETIKAMCFQWDSEDFHQADVVELCDAEIAAQAKRTGEIAQVKAYFLILKDHFPDEMDNSTAYCMGMDLLTDLLSEGAV